MRLRGIPASPGIGHGPAQRYSEAGRSIGSPKGADPSGERSRLASDPEAEARRFLAAVERTRAELRALADEVGDEQGGIFAAHLLMLDDPLLLEGVVERIRARSERVETALPEVVDALARPLRELDDDYFRQRAKDVEDVGRRLLRNCAGETATKATVLSGAVVVARDLTPSEVLACSQAGAAALATEEGAASSHASILARSLGLPAVVGVAGLLDAVVEGAPALVDGDAGVVGVGEPVEAPEAPGSAPARPRRARRVAGRGELRTVDGRRVRLYANVGRPEELEWALAAGAEGVGVLRTEFLFLEEPPSEERQYDTYRDMAERLAGRPLVIRTLDAGGDKPLPYLRVPREDNPFLGLRGLRLSLERPDVFATQLRAILRARQHGDVRLLYPMVSDASELLRARRVLDRCRAELAREGHTLPDEVEAGAMVEVPAAAICADLLAREAAFLSVGTNDLAQYVLAADRNNPLVAGVYDQTHLAVLRLVRMAVEGAHRHGRLLAVCGEVASDLAAVPLLVGLGVDELSVAPPALEGVRSAVAAVSYATAAAEVARRLG